MTNFTDIFIRRPVLSIVIALIIFLLGIISYFSLPVREFPLVSSNVVRVTVNYAGASPDIMESSVTTPLESVIADVNDVDYISSGSRQGVSDITVYAKLNSDVNVVANDITNKVMLVRKLLPSGIDDPVITKQDPDVYGAMYIGFQSNKMTVEDISDYIWRVVLPQLRTVNGVGGLKLEGSKFYAMRLWLDPYAMAAKNITPIDIYDVINKTQVYAATGIIKNRWQKMPLNAISTFNTAQQFGDLVLRSDKDQVVKLSDVGRVELGVDNSDSFFELDNRAGVLVDVFPKADANFLEISQRVTAAITKLQKYFPADLTAKVILDASDYVKNSIFEIKKTLIYAAFFVMLVVFLFLGSLRLLFIPIVVIPLSLVGAFAVMWALGYSLNTLTFLALVLAIGMVVDDAIVVLENIYRHINAGKDPREAALMGAREIQFAVISITLTLAAVYAPIGFASGLTRVLFKEFAFTLAAAVIISGIIALVLSPLMCARIMTRASLAGAFSQATHNFSAKITEYYAKLLNRVLNKRLLVVMFLLLSFIACFFIYRFLPQELAPKEDAGWVWTQLNAPATANFSFLQKYARRVNAALAAIPEGVHYGVAYGASDGGAFIGLVPWDKRKRSNDQIIDELRTKYAKIPGINASPYNPYILPGSASYVPVNVAIQTTGSYEELSVVMQQLKKALKNNPKIINVDNSLKINQPQLDIIIDRHKASALGIPVSDIVNSLDLAFGEPTITNFTISGRKYNFVPQLDMQYKDRFDAVNNLQLRTASGVLVPLSNLVALHESVRPQSFGHFQQTRAAGLTASLLPGYTLGEALRYIEATAKKIMSPQMKIDYFGQSRQFMEQGNAMALTFVFAIIFIFLVLAVQFESFRDPLIVMFTVPFSILGALLILLLTRSSINIYSQIGMLTLIGLITKHGILMVTFANQERKKGAEIYAAIMQAAKIRLRPILMTTFAMILGALPLACASGAGSISRHQIGWVIIGGMMVGTLFTLFVIPVMYALISKKNIAHAHE